MHWVAQLLKSFSYSHSIWQQFYCLNIGFLYMLQVHRSKTHFIRIFIQFFLSLFSLCVHDLERHQGKKELQTSIWHESIRIWNDIATNRNAWKDLNTKNDLVNILAFTIDINMKCLSLNCRRMAKKRQANGEIWVLRLHVTNIRPKLVPALSSDDKQILCGFTLRN